mgnify:CR=1 FL=1
METRSHWERVYATRGPDALSWYQPHAQLSLDLIRRIGAGSGTRVIDVGAGASKANTPCRTAMMSSPVRSATLVTTLRSALRARARQYDVRDSIDERNAAATILRDSEARLAVMWPAASPAAASPPGTRPAARPAAGGARPRPTRGGPWRRSRS